MDLSFLRELNMLSMLLRICCAAFAGGLLSIKPVISLEDGEVKLKLEVGEGVILIGE